MEINGDFVFGQNFYTNCYNLDPTTIVKLLPEEIENESTIFSNGLKNYSSLMSGTNLKYLNFVNKFNVNSKAFLICGSHGMGQLDFVDIPPLRSSDETFYLNVLDHFATCQNISIQSLKNLVKYMYEKRFIHKQLYNIDSKIILNLQPFNYSKEQLGPYRNTTTPRHINEFIYKLVENPNGEDIDKYEVLYNMDEITSVERNYQVVVEMDVQLTEPKEVSSICNSENMLNSRRCYIDWGDGNTSFYESEMGEARKARILKNFYTSPGNYTVKLFLNNIDISHTRSSLYGNLINNSSDVISIRLKSNIPSYLPIRSLLNIFPNLESFSYNEDKNNKAVMGSYLFETFRGCSSLRYISPLYITYATTASSTRMFTGTGNIESVVLENMFFSFNIADNKLNGDSLNALFEGLATVSTPQTVTVTGNPGVLESTYDPSIATLKGWTVVD